MISGSDRFGPDLSIPIVSLDLREGAPQIARLETMAFLDEQKDEWKSQGGGYRRILLAGSVQLEVKPQGKSWRWVLLHQAKPLESGTAHAVATAMTDCKNAAKRRFDDLG